MYCNKSTTLLLLLLSGCSTTSVIPDSGNEPSQNNTNSTETAKATSSDIQDYKDALTYLNLNKYGEAEKKLKEFTQRQPNLAGAWANLGLLYCKKSEWDKAESALEIAITKNPSLSQALNTYGYVEYKKGNLKKAEGYYLQAIDAKPDNALAHYNLALLYDIYYQDAPKAIIHYEKYLEFTKEKDEITKDWLEQLKNSQKESKP